MEGGAVSQELDLASRKGIPESVAAAIIRVQHQAEQMRENIAHFDYPNWNVALERLHFLTVKSMKAIDRAIPVEVGSQVARPGEDADAAVPELLRTKLEPEMEKRDAAAFAAAMTSTGAQSLDELVARVNEYHEMCTYLAENVIAKIEYTSEHPRPAPAEDEAETRRNAAIILAVLHGMTPAE